MKPPSKRQMHPRNVFKTPPDYTDLAIKYADFRQICKLELSGKVSIDYKNESTLRLLTQTLLKEYFQLDVKFAPGSLVPTLPLRLNFILWLEDLMLAMGITNNIRGIDIGCGSACIYSLLAAKKNAWHMLALESNQTNIEYATENIQNNNLCDLIEVFAQHNKNVIFKDYFATVETERSYHFCLCNPPFYDANHPIGNTTRNPNKRPPPHNCHTGNNEELACAGGETEFVQHIITESLMFRDRIGIYTTMLGHKSSLTKVIELLQKNGISNYCTTEFVQGNTTRWGIAWSFKAHELNKQA